MVFLFYDRIVQFWTECASFMENSYYAFDELSIFSLNEKLITSYRTGESSEDRKGKSKGICSKHTER
jgi:hypothetical protein